jgi:ribonucleoside-diphosphate reductase alpha chain
MAFIPGYREANAPKRNGKAENGHGNGNGHEVPSAESNGAATVAPRPPTVPAATEVTPGLHELTADGPQVRSQQFAKFQADAPACDNCGAITVRNGNCYLCHNCGNSMGCS